MEKNKLLKHNNNSMGIPQKNPFSKMVGFTKVTTSGNSMKVFLSVAKNRTVQLPKLIQDTSLELKDIVISLDDLEKGDFVKRNPNPLSKRYKLGFNGQLFAEQLKNTYPDVKSFLGEKKIIEPLSD